MNAKTTVLGILLLLVVSLFAAAAVSAATVSDATVPVEILEVKVDGDKVDQGEKLSIERQADGDTKVDVKVKLRASQDSDDLRMKIELEGYEDETLRDETSWFNLDAGRSTFKELSLSLPDDI